MTLSASHLSLFAFALALFFPPLARADVPVTAVRYEQRLGAQLPLDVVLRDETGAPRALRTFFGPRPVVLAFGYFRCPQLCSVVADGTITALSRVRPLAGDAYDFIYVSIDPTDTPADAWQHRADAGRRYGRTPVLGAGFHYLTGTQAALDRLTAAAGFHAVYDPRSKQYAHPSGFVVVTPSGVVSRYFLGVDFDPAELATAIKRAAAGQQGESVFDLLLLCFRGETISGRYGRAIWLSLETAVAATVLTLAGGIVWMLRNERRSSPPSDSAFRP